jgi:hypothetical protein
VPAAEIGRGGLEFAPQTASNLAGHTLMKVEKESGESP